MTTLKERKKKQREQNQKDMFEAYKLVIDKVGILFFANCIIRSGAQNKNLKSVVGCITLFHFSIFHPVTTHVGISIINDFFDLWCS